MKTTALRIEILIIGFQSMLWIWLLSGFPFDVIVTFVSDLEGSSLLATFMFFGACFTAGSLVDSTSGIIETIYFRMRHGIDKNRRSSKFWLEHTEAASQMMQRYFDLRVLRGTVFNIFLFLIVSVFTCQPWYLTTGSASFFFLAMWSWSIRKKVLTERLTKLVEACDPAGAEKVVE